MGDKMQAGTVIKNRVYLVGAGPGDPMLLTLKGKRVIEQAEVIIYDHLVNKEILSLADPDAELIFAGKVPGQHTMPQEEINELLVSKAREGKRVVRLKGGDPFVFGRGGEEALFLLEHGLEYEVVPGISSALAVPAYAGIPVTHRGISSSFAVITGHEKPDKKTSSIKWEKITLGTDTLIFLMGVEHLADIVKQLHKNGRSKDTPVCIISNGTLAEQKIVTGTLGNIATLAEESALTPPAVIVVGEVVNLQAKLEWLTSKPLWGKKIIVTRPKAQAEDLIARIREAGGEAIPLPSIVIKKSQDLEDLHNCFNDLSQYKWIIFTSANAVEVFFAEMFSQKHDIRELCGLSIAAIGPATAEALRKKGIMVDFYPEEYVAEALVQQLAAFIHKGDKVLLPRAWGARKVLPESLHELGAKVDEICLYKSDVPEKVDLEFIKSLETADYITFTSSSAVKNFMQMMRTEQIFLQNQNLKIACIGPVTAETVKEYGLKVHLQAQEYTVDCLLEAIINDVKSPAEERKGIL